MKYNEVCLADVCDLIAGYAFKSKDFGDFDDKVIKITHITPPIVDMNGLSGVDFSKYNREKLKRYIAKSGDYVLAMTGATIGKIGRIVRGEAYINQRVLLFKNKDAIDKDFLYYVLLQHDFEQYVYNHIDSESAQPNISATTIGKYIFSLPPMSIQQKIGRLLRSLDKKCEVNNAINHNLEQQASALVGHYMQSIDTSVSIANIMSFDSGFPFQSSTYLPSGKYRIITIKNVQDGNIETSNTVFINNLPTRMKNNCILHVGDVLLSLTGNVGRVGIVCEENLLLNQRVAKIVPNDIGLLPLLYFIFRQPDIKLQMELIAKGTAQSNLSPVETLRLTIPFERKTAEALSRTLAPMYQTIISTTQESHSLSSLRDALLPKLMSGEIDVSEVEL